ncbi:MAG: OmpA family protein [Myxococcota bacterium]
MERRSIARGVTSAIALVAILVGCQQTAPVTGGEPEGEFTPDTGEVESVESVELSELKTIYFDFDQANIRADQRAELQADAKAIEAQPDLGVVTLQGNCDERGSEEYNLALGDRRAAAVKTYLVDLGVSASRLRTVSFGESKSAVAGHDESAWKWNRRVDFAVTR